MAAKCAHSGTQRNEDEMESNGTGSEPENGVVPAIRLGSVTATVTVPRGRAQQGAKRHERASAGWGGGSSGRC